MTDEEEDDGVTSGESTGDKDLDRQVADLEKERDRVGDQIDETRNDWESSKGDQSVPGAVPDPYEIDDAASGGDDASDEDDDG